jgi:tetratricopeptide (TPR) repeat protein
LGIAYLEQADFPDSLRAFRDALRRAPQWTYPYHNMALAAFETGDHESAIRLYRQAILLTPRFSYLHYNLAVVYERVNRRKEAELEFRKAIELSPDLADAYNGLGSIEAASGKFAAAENSYRHALQLNPALYAARQNLAVLLAGRPGRRTDAIALWRDNLARNPEFLPSRLSLAEALASDPDPAMAIGEYRRVVERKPDYVAARIALADLLLKTGAWQEALEQTEAANQLAPGDEGILERIGDIQSFAGHSKEAHVAYQSALTSSPDRTTSKRLRSKLIR